MTTSFKHGLGQYLAVTIPAGRRELEAKAEDIQPDPKLWSPRSRRQAMGLRLEDETAKSEYTRKNISARRRAAKLGMRELRQRRAA